MTSGQGNNKSCEASQNKKEPFFAVSRPAVYVTLITIAIAVVGWFTLPSRIPSHWNLAGDIDGYGSKWVTLLVAPIFQLVMLLFYGFFAPIKSWLVPAPEPKLQKRKSLISFFTAFLLFFFLIQAHIFLAGAGVRIDVRTVIILSFAFLAFFSGMRCFRHVTPVLCAGAFFPSLWIWFFWTALAIGVVFLIVFDQTHGVRKYRIKEVGSSIYSDKLVEITEKSILFRWYYFPFGRRRVPLSEIDHIIAKEPSLLSGKWRIHGTRDFKMWFPCDWKRPKRDRIFIATLRNEPTKIGFTVEDSEKVQDILREKKLLKDE